MRVLLVNNFWYPRGGAETVVLATKDLLEKSGHTVALFGTRHPANLFDNKYFVPYVDFDHLSWWGKIRAGINAVYHREAVKNFRALILEFNPEVIHFHNIYHQLSFGLIGVAKELGIPMVMSAHDYHLISPNYRLFSRGQVDERCAGQNYWRCAWHNCLENRGRSLIASVDAFWTHRKKYADMIGAFISPSDFMKKKLAQFGIDESKITVARNPVESAWFSDGDDNGDDGYVLYFGRLSEEKGIDVLLAAAKYTPNIRYVIAGVGPEEKFCHDLVAKYDLKNIELVGFKTGAEIWALVARARLVVLPSLWYENCPMSVIEALAKGKIVIASRVGGLPEILTDELLVEPGDSVVLAGAIKYWHGETPANRHDSVRSITEKIKKEFSPEWYLSRLLEIYSDVSR
ncbi:MAG: glycosyltransferase [Candidatus Magasanikbacteria bacterium]